MVPRGLAPAARAEVPVTAGCRPVPSAEMAYGPAEVIPANLVRDARQRWQGIRLEILQVAAHGVLGGLRTVGARLPADPAPPGSRRRASPVHRADRTAAGLPGVGRRTRLRIREPAPPAPRPRGTRPPAAGRAAAVPLHPDGEPAGARLPGAILGRAGLAPGRAGRARLRVRRPRPRQTPGSRRVGRAAAFVPARTGPAQLVRRVPFRAPFPRGGDAGDHPDRGHDGVRRRRGDHRRRERQQPRRRGPASGRPRVPARDPGRRATSARRTTAGASARRSAR